MCKSPLNDSNNENESCDDNNQKIKSKYLKFNNRKPTFYLTFTILISECVFVIIFMYYILVK